MIKTIRRVFLGAVTLMVAAILTAGPAFAGHCTNADKVPTAGNQIVVNASFQVISLSTGVQQRVDQGLIDLTTGEGFSGLIGIDFTGDGVADLTTFLVGPTFAIPDVAQLSGAPCHGTVSIEEFFTNCLS